MALSSITAGSNNTATGSQALTANKTGSANTADGAGALASNNGSWNTATGSQALNVNSTGSNNTGTGNRALQTNDAGSNNAAVGACALLNTTRSGNSQACAAAAPGSADANTAMGTLAGKTNATGNSNTFVGFGADAASGGLTNATAIGANAVVSASNALVLGGTGANAVNVGIGTASPSATLQIDENNAQNADTLLIGSTSRGLRMRDTGTYIDLESFGDPLFINNTTGQNTILNGNGGKVGIGTGGPTATLEVNGTGKFDGLVTFAPSQTFPGMGTVTSVGSGAGLTGGPITGSGTLSIASGGVTNTMLASPSLTVTAGSGLSGGGPVSLGGSTTLSLNPNVGGSSGVFFGSNVTPIVFVTQGGSGMSLLASNTTNGSLSQLGTSVAVNSVNYPTGVYGSDGGSGGFGVYGSGANYGVYGSGTNYGVYGVGSGSVPTGVYGIGFYGVQGYTTADGGAYNGSPIATGVYGNGGMGTGVQGEGGSVGVYGDSTGFGVQGNAISCGDYCGTGVYGTGNSYGVLSEGNFGVVNGSKAAVVALPDDRVVELYAMESPENWFEDFGADELRDGAAEVTLDPTFALTVNLETDYHVFLTPKGDCEGLYVTNETATGFQVRELRGGKSNVGFDYRIIAKRRGYESVRMDELETDAETLRRIRGGVRNRPAHRKLILPRLPEAQKLIAQPARVGAPPALTVPVPHPVGSR